jgi:hypothetical protein
MCTHSSELGSLVSFVLCTAWELRIGFTPMLFSDVRADVYELVWTTTGQPTSYTNWDSDEPDLFLLEDYRNSDLACVYSGSHWIGWFMDSCDIEYTTLFVCEYPYVF